MSKRKPKVKAVPARKTQQLSRSRKFLFATVTTLGSHQRRWNQLCQLSRSGSDGRTGPVRSRPVYHLHRPKRVPGTTHVSGIVRFVLPAHGSFVTRLPNSNGNRCSQCAGSCRGPTHSSRRSETATFGNLPGNLGRNLGPFNVT